MRVGADTNSLAYADMCGRLWVHAEWLRTVLKRTRSYIDPEDTYLIECIEKELGNTEYLEGTFHDKFHEIEARIEESK